MKGSRSRLAVMGVLALAFSVTVGFVSGSVADAKKKKKKSNSVTVSVTTPTPIPVAATPSGPPSVTVVPLTVGKKAKGKIVSFSSVSVTTTWTGSDTQALGAVTSQLVAPINRGVLLNAPVWNFAAPPGQANQTSGPLTETPDSITNPCFSDTAHPCPGGVAQDAEATLGPPYSGTIGNGGLEAFGGISPVGTWFLKIYNQSTTRTSTLNSVTLTIGLQPKPLTA
jgi:hypothetical protein